MEEVENRIVISKRKGEGEDSGQEKRLRVETQAALAIVEKQEIARSSTLLAPTMLLTGHQAAVYTLKFDPTGLQLASAGADRAIFLWDTRGECDNYNVLRGHKNVSSRQSVLQSIAHTLLYSYSVFSSRGYKHTAVGTSNVGVCKTSLCEYLYAITIVGNQAVQVQQLPVVLIGSTKSNNAAVWQSKDESTIPEYATRRTCKERSTYTPYKFYNMICSLQATNLHVLQDHAHISTTLTSTPTPVRRADKSPTGVSLKSLLRQKKEAGWPCAVVWDWSTNGSFTAVGAQIVCET